jgi:flagellar biosynthetic protein FliR
MTLLETQLAAWLADFFWPMLRIGAVFVSSPIFNARQVSARSKALLAVSITIVIVPTLPEMPVVEVFSPLWVVIMVQQIAIGLMMGFVLQMVFGALVYGGQVLAYSMGLGFASMVDPANGLQTPVMSQIFLLLATLLFLVTNSHLVLINLVVDSFHTFPVGANIEAMHWWNLAAWGSRMFAGGLLMALPVVATLLLINLGMGVMARAAPQFNLFAVGFPITMTLGFIIIWMSLPSVMTDFLDLLDEALHLISTFVGITP